MNELQFTAAQAAYVLQEPVRAVKKSLDTGPIRAGLSRRSGGSVRVITFSDLIYLFAVRTLREELTPKARNEFYHALQIEKAQRPREVRFGQLSVRVSDVVEEVEKRTTELNKLGDKVEFRGDGEPLLKGTTIEVHRIAALLNGGSTAEDVVADYPSLTIEQVGNAKAYADAHPKAGRPYPQTTAKRAMRGLGLEALEHDDSFE